MYVLPHLTSASLTMDTSGNMVSRISYLPYGATRSATGALPTERKFTGQRLDGTGLYFYNARYYDAGIGQFVSPDPITHSQPLPSGKTIEALTVSYNGTWARGFGQEPNTGTIPSTINPQEHNRYSHTINNPLRYVDPTGNQVEAVVIVAGAGLIVYAVVASFEIFYFQQDPVDYQSIGQSLGGMLDTARKGVSSAVNKLKSLFGSSANSGNPDPNSKDDRKDPKVPKKVTDLLDKIKANEGRAPEGYQGGRIFENRELRLPQGVNYKEYDVNPLSSAGRGPERVVIGDDGSVWYTEDHYATFTRIQ